MENAWLREVAVISGRSDEGRVDGVELLASVIKDGVKNFQNHSLIIPKYASIKDECEFESFYNCMHFILVGQN